MRPTATLDKGRNCELTHYDHFVRRHTDVWSIVTQAVIETEPRDRFRFRQPVPLLAATCGKRGDLMTNLKVGGQFPIGTLLPVTAG
jgi:hypothetical protein